MVRSASAGALLAGGDDVRPDAQLFGAALSDSDVQAATRDLVRAAERARAGGLDGPAADPPPGVVEPEED